MTQLLTAPGIALLGREPYHRWLQIAFPVRQRTQFIYGCYLGIMATTAEQRWRTMLAVQMILVGRETTVGVPGKTVVVQPGAVYSFDPRAMLIDNALLKILYHPWMTPIDQHTTDTRRWLLDHPEWIPKGWINGKLMPEDLPLNQRIRVLDEPTTAGDRQAVTQVVPSSWVQAGDRRHQFRMVVDVESDFDH